MHFIRGIQIYIIRKYTNKFDKHLWQLLVKMTCIYFNPYVFHFAFKTSQNVVCNKLNVGFNDYKS